MWFWGRDENRERERLLPASELISDSNNLHSYFYSNLVRTSCLAMNISRSKARKLRNQKINFNKSQSLNMIADHSSLNRSGLEPLVESEQVPTSFSKWKETREEKARLFHKLLYGDLYVATVAGTIQSQYSKALILRQQIDSSI